MVVQKAINNLKAGPKEDKVAVASGIAVSVVVVLLVAWAILFFRNIQRGAQQVNLGGGAQEQFNFTSVREAQQRLQQEYGASAQTDELIDARNSSAAGSNNVQVQSTPQQTQGKSADQFSSPNSSY